MEVAERLSRPDEAPDHEGDGDDAGDPEGDLVEGELAVPAFRHGLLGLGLAQFLQDLVVVFGVQVRCGRERIRGHRSRGWQVAPCNSVSRPEGYAVVMSFSHLLSRCHYSVP